MGNIELVLNQAAGEVNAQIIGFLLDSLNVAEHKDTLFSCFKHKINVEIPPTRGMNVGQYIDITGVMGVGCNVTNSRGVK